MLNTIYETGYDLHVANYVAYLHTDKKLYEDEQVVAFYDINPQAKVHFLVIPKKHITSAAALTEKDGALLGHIFAVIAKLAKEQGLENGYRVISNVGEDAGQTVKHLHFHVLGGEKLPV